MNGICKLCLEEKELRQSHILPKHIYKQSGLMPKYEPMVFLNASKTRALPVENKSYDGEKEYLFCYDCEQLLANNYEGVASRLFYQPEDSLKDLKIKISKTSLGPYNFRTIEGLNYHSIKLYFLSIMYRLSISQGYSDFSLGEDHNEKIRIMILSGDGSDESEYMFLRFRPEDRNGRKGQIISPRLNPLVNSKGHYFMQVIGGSLLMFKYHSRDNVGELNLVFDYCNIRKNGTMSEGVLSNEDWLNEVIRPYSEEYLKGSPIVEEYIRKSSGKKLIKVWSFTDQV